MQLLNTKGYLVILVIAVIHRYRIWVGLSIAFFLWKLVWHFFGKKVYKSVPAQGLLDPTSEVHNALASSSVEQ